MANSYWLTQKKIPKCNQGCWNSKCKFG